MLAFICFQTNPCLKSSLGFPSASVGSRRPLSNITCSDLLSAAMPTELGHFHALRVQTCREMCYQHLCHPSFRHHSHLLQWKRARDTLEHAVYKRNQNSLPLLQRGTFNTYKMRSGSPFLGPHTYKPIFLGIKAQSSSLCLSLSCSEK